MMMGKCINFGVLEPNIILFGGATGVWTPISDTKGTFVVTHLAGEACGGTVDYSQYAAAIFVFEGCGRVKVTIEGRGQRYLALPDAEAYIDSGPGILMSGADAEVPCDSVPLILLSGSNPQEWAVRCGSSLTLAFNALTNSNAPALTCTFTVEAVA